MKKIGILTTFTQFDPQYSLCTVTQDLVETLQTHGYSVTLIAVKYPGCVFPNVRMKYLPLVYLGNMPEDVKKDFDTKVAEIYQAYEELLPEFDLILTIDIMFQKWFLAHNAALRLYAEQHSEARFIHWMHSAPCTPPNPLDYPDKFRFESMPNSIWVTMNYVELPLAAKMFGIPEAYVRVVYNPRNPQNFFKMHPFVKTLIAEHDLLSQDIVMVYPLDTTRFGAKGGDKAIKLLHALEKEHQKVKLIFCNAWANDEDEQKAVNDRRQPNVIFTSHYTGYERGVPNEVVRDLMLISNVFFLGSDSEGCSLTLLEAALTKNLIVLNDDFPAMHEFGEIDNVIYMKLGSVRASTDYHGQEEQYYQSIARQIVVELQQNKALKMNRKVLQRFNSEWIFKNQLEPLIK